MSQRRVPPSPRGFTLLETVVALAILALALMAIFDLNAGAVANHAYTKKLTVATLLARSKMTDLEQQLYDKGFSNDDDEESGDFSEEGWSQFKWRARILAPKTQGVSPEQMVSAIFNVPMGTGGLQEMLDSFGGKGGKDGAANPALPPGATQDASAGIAGAMGPLIQGQFTQMIDQITKSVREVHLTVSWKDGTQVESFDLVTHVVSLGTGSDRNGGQAAESGVVTNTPGSGGGDGAPPADGQQPPGPMYAADGTMVPAAMITGRGGQWINKYTGQIMYASPPAGAGQNNGNWRPTPGTQPPGFNKSGSVFQ
ncbi:prepilin-type N-terminal cleavage/methylation domain-containing protein [Aggregicoccus sp. 17bor-14]|uniref:prepilin-type N-terminal cleavage/methylation domain-containing protein n=1 Tax=Myxococcaceae TaxID=31 RepID=UPI00129D047C|nr:MULTISPECIES: prepilin-type N-terminal cleavage/methylation domain-containing protein [Myxococcaceae]MBF5044904.1 prepilin-type N-terminal cleavage/methylation domain-containing protein [Simulacricoccus sp. 17bor-14]MRI90648.1 prepilin-type N-terminal cleavage/methylation domain-containing protein [Aggregicoccus sp. 17bor-14]